MLSRRWKLSSATAVIVAALVLPRAASAAWLGYKNDTKAAIVVQTSVVVNNKIVRGKAHNLYPGEIAWDNIPIVGPRQIAIYDPKANNKQIFQDTVNVQNADVFVSVRTETLPATPGKAAPQPQIKLVPTKLPGPPGVVPATTPAPSVPPGQVPVRPPQAPSPPLTPGAPPKPEIPVKPDLPPPSSGKSGT